MYYVHIRRDWKAKTDSSWVSVSKNTPRVAVYNRLEQMFSREKNILPQSTCALKNKQRATVKVATRITSRAQNIDTISIYYLYMLWHKCVFVRLLELWFRNLKGAARIRNKNTVPAIFLVLSGLIPCTLGCNEINIDKLANLLKYIIKPRAIVIDQYKL